MKSTNHSRVILKEPAFYAGTMKGYRIFHYSFKVFIMLIDVVNYTDYAKKTLCLLYIHQFPGTFYLY
jgi:hypothetical protein